MNETTIELLESTANMLRGVCMDPRIPQDTKEALWSRVCKLDIATEAALTAPDDIADAARFRWLDEVALGVDMVADPDNLVQVWHETLSGHPTTGRTLREAVDEAMKRHKGVI